MKEKNYKSSKCFRVVHYTYDDPRLYNGPIVKGWPPTRDRFIPKYMSGTCVFDLK